MNRIRRSTPDLSGAKWRSSSYSGGNNECVEVADDVPALIPVRDSKRPTGPALAFSVGAWAAFVDGLRGAGRVGQ
ncbi:DUF397 domain-containing protein [Streptomyces sp. ISL-12]|uniref:DUF397 domain-containing protein n=1 Tax=Streptomyces sp. ISL-12 TaxID=2819177 RepID=UPI001BE54CC3|nr:DUF397 domain-containing protein [Streptomyces sp. ISL-12]MBT2409100.1 DUF397 domain-containing protein [Streptomyces sp. ISL-12]